MAIDPRPFTVAITSSRLSAYSVSSGGRTTLPESGVALVMALLLFLVAERPIPRQPRRPASEIWAQRLS
ncbi:MAG: hypothetical protein EA346_00945 [Thioalkalivibrio sp.]|nr:MAG: hypothetical protein EA346_00945 [Thioalkalivibrio sp.]